MRQCNITCDKCGQPSKILTPIKNFDICVGSDGYHFRANTNTLYLQKDLCNSCKHDLKSHIERFFK